MTELRLERLVPEMEFGTVMRWLKARAIASRPASRSSRSRPTRSSQEIAAPVGGTLAEIVAVEGDELTRRRRARDHRGGLGDDRRRPFRATAQLRAQPARSMQRDPRLRGRGMELFGEKLIRGSAHPYIGQEAIAVGVCDALARRRPHHQHAPRPRPLHRQGPRPAADDGRDHRPRDRLLPRQGRLMHITAMRHGMLGADAIVGGSAGHRRRRGVRRCGCRATTPSSVAFFGDGASNQGIFHEAANLAAVLKAPVRLRLREQPLGDLDAVRAAVDGARHRDPRGRLRLPGRDRRRQRRAAPSARSPSGPSRAPAPARGRR